MFKKLSAMVLFSVSLACVAQQPPAGDAQIRKDIDSTLVIQKVEPKPFVKREGGQDLPVELTVKNLTGKDLAGFKAQIRYTDQSGNEIIRLVYTSNENYLAHQQKVFRGNFQVDPSMDGWKKFLATPPDKMTPAAQITYIAFKDGTTLTLK